MNGDRVAQLDVSLSAVIVSRLPLHYHDGGDPSLDRPAHVRAASSAAWIGECIALVQDDANFVAMLQPRDGTIRAIALPAGEGGVRLFDDGRGNKKFKLDLEACAAIVGESGPQLLAFGSGSRKRRRRIATVLGLDGAAPEAVVHDATSLYERLEQEERFAGSDMNLEGALAVGDMLRLFGRGNGQARRGLLPLNATCDLPLSELFAFLANPERARAPEPRDVVRYALGAINGISLGFTDAALLGEHMLYTAAAEASEDASEDGAVGGSALGVIAPDGTVRYALLHDANGRLLPDKVEGIVVIPGSHQRAYIVIDQDDATRPSELCEVELRGSWSD